MGDIASGIFADLARFLRVMYPGILVMLLYDLSSVDAGANILAKGNGNLALFFVAAAVIVASMVLYAFQRYLIQEWIVHYLLQWVWGWGDLRKFAERRKKAGAKRMTPGGKKPLRVNREPRSYAYYSHAFDSAVKSSYWESRARYSSEGWGYTHAFGISWWA